MIERNQSRIGQNFVTLGDQAMRITPHAETIRRTELCNGGLEAAYPVCIIFEKLYGSSVHRLMIQADGRLCACAQPLHSDPYQ